MRKKLIVGNWKMNGSFDMAGSLVGGILNQIRASDEALMVICPPSPYLQFTAGLLEPSNLVEMGAQDVSEHASGAYTGEVSTAMLQEFGCKYVITGHSERRQYHGETNEQVARKTLAALKSGIRPIACVGETLFERKAGQAKRVIEQQLDAILEIPMSPKGADFCIAYEPVWAIGTGQVAQPGQAQQAHEWIRQRTAEHSAELAQDMRILYGGSVNSSNAAQILQQSDIDGCLIGGASLNSDEFLKIYNVAN